MRAKAYFESLGRSDQSRGIPLLAGREHRITWPRWAREAYAAGRFKQEPYQVGKSDG